MHSKGPWRAEIIYDEYFDIVDADGYDVAEEVGSDDADLIAAAPEMLEALRKAERQLRENGDNGNVYRELVAAIAKAEGRTP